MGLTDYTFGDKRIWNAGREYEKERIIKLWGQEMDCKCEDSMGHLLAQIKGEK